MDTDCRIDSGNNKYRRLENHGHVSGLRDSGTRFMPASSSYNDGKANMARSRLLNT